MNSLKERSPPISPSHKVERIGNIAPVGEIIRQIFINHLKLKS
ncbi:hypothetical protein [Pedobacter agri]|nr:hypothetical protein [Pedobacter agri]